MQPDFVVKACSSSSVPSLHHCIFQAVKWFRLSARQGFPQACQNLGMCYQTGAGVEKDLPKAVELFRQAVEGGRCVHVVGEAAGGGYVFTLVALKIRQRAE